MRLLLACALLVAASTPALSQGAAHDGNSWRDRSSDQRSMYVVALIDGMQLGHRFAYWGAVEKDKLAEFRAVSSFEEHWEKYVLGVRSDQLSDGLDAFYADYQNRRIKVIDGVWLVLNGIAGKPKEELERMIEAFRRNATSGHESPGTALDPV